MKATDSRKSDFTETFSVILKLESMSIIIDGACILDFYFIEDIMSFCMTGKIEFIDKHGIVEYGPLTGNEQIVLSYGEKEDRQLVFDIVRIGRIIQSNPSDPTSESVLTIHFADTSLEYFTRRKYSRSWSNTSISDITKHILKYWISDPKIGQWEDNNTKIDLTMPYWTPIEVMMWLSKRGRGAKSGIPGFVYFNNTQDNMRANWTSLDYLFGIYPKVEEDPYIFEGENVYYRNKILDWWISGIDKFSFKGIKGGHRFGYDFNTKTLLNQVYGYSTSVEKSMLMGRFSLYTDITDYRSNFIIEGESTTESLDNIFHSGWLKRYNMQQALNIIVRGYEDRYAGMQIGIEWTSSDRRQMFNKTLKGKWLIKSITHSFNARNNIPYRQRLVLLKNAYNDIDHKTLVKATRKNI